jgi:beta-mannosidase
MQQISLSGKWEFRQAGTGEWMTAIVPGGAHTDLLSQGKIPDPFVADNEERVQWVAESDWEYRRTFFVPEEILRNERVELVCDGLDTLFDAQLNGTVIGAGDNMYRQYRWEVKGILKPKLNELTILFRSPVNYVRAKSGTKPLRGVPQAIEGGPHLRKAPCQFGWDWGPRLPPVGIWKDLRLEGYSIGRFSDIHLRQAHRESGVLISAGYSVEQWGQTELAASMELVDPEGVVTRVESPASVGSLVVKIPNPQLWWPNGYGAQPLYQVKVSLFAAGRTLDERRFQVGLRTVELRREPDAWGESFTFVVNGVPVFAKGADWIPADSFPTRLNSTHLEQLIQSTAQAHMNMLRVWGGGLYEEEGFYDLCDRYGLLVWQDFTFACSIYPENAEFFENVRQEAIENVRRLRHRASLALWCGNNEMEQGWVDWGWNKPADPINQRLKEGYDRMFHHLLPEVCRTEDPDRPYWPSSASSGIPFSEPNSQLRGDVHYWDVWHGRKPFTAYRSQFPRFMSEFGFQALPPLETIRAYAEPKDWNMTSHIMEWHQRSFSGNGLMMGQMTDTFRMPKDFPALVYLSMVLQAEGIRYGVEHWRRNKHRVSGTLIWQLNDCWPVASWSSIDYFGRWKALHYAAKRFYAPVLLSIEDDGLQMDVHVTSDVNELWQGEVRWQLCTLDGIVLQSGSALARLPALTSAKVVTQVFDLTPEQRRRTYFTCELWQKDTLISCSVALFAPNKHLEISDPGLKVDVRQVGQELTFTVTAQTLARFVELKIKGQDVIFSDNYFDVVPGLKVEVHCLLPQGLGIAEVKQLLSVYSLWQSYSLT